MAKTRRRVLSILMALVLTLGLLPTAALASGGNTTIKVVDQSGAPINGAEVTVERGFYHESNTTGDSGTVSFNLSYHKYSKYSFSVSAFGYTGKTGYVKGSGTHTVQLDPSREGSRDNPEVRFYVLDPDKGTPTDNNNENKGDYYPNDDENNPDRNGGIPGLTASTGYTGGKLTEAGKRAIYGRGDSGLFSADGSAFSGYYTAPTNLGMFNDDTIVWYSMKEYPNDDKNPTYWYCNIDGYVKDVEVNIYYHPNYTGATGYKEVPTKTGAEHQVLTYAATDLTARSGYTFTGWNTKADGTGETYTAGQKITVTGPMSLYAQWDEIKYTPSEQPTATLTLKKTWASGITSGEAVTITLEDASGNSYTAKENGREVTPGTLAELTFEGLTPGAAYTIKESPETYILDKTQVKLEPSDNVGFALIQNASVEEPCNSTTKDLKGSNIAIVKKGGDYLIWTAQPVTGYEDQLRTDANEIVRGKDMTSDNTVFISGKQTEYTWQGEKLTFDPAGTVSFTGGPKTWALIWFGEYSYSYGEPDEAYLTVKNSPKVGSLTISKTFSYEGTTNTSAPAGFDATFVVKNESGTKVGELTYAEILAGNNTISNLPYDTYTVTENITNAGNPGAAYNRDPQVSYNSTVGTSGTVLLNSAAASMAVANHYKLTNSPIVGITKDATASATVGDTITYTITVTNTGGGDAGGVVVTDKLPTTGLNLYRVELYTKNGATETKITDPEVAKIEDGTVTWHVGELAKLTGSATLLVKVQVAESALEIADKKITNTASVTYDGYDGDPISDDATTTITRSNLNVAKTAVTYSTYDAADPTKNVVSADGSTAQPGDTIVYTITVTNSGDAAASGVSVTDKLPASGYTFVSATDGKQPANGEITWTGLTVAADGGKVEKQVVVTVDQLANPSQGITLTNTAVLGEQKSEVTTTVGATKGTLTISKTISGVPAEDTAAWNVLKTLTFTVEKQVEGEARQGSGEPSYNWVAVTGLTNIAITAFTGFEAENGTYTYDCGNVEPGTYRVVEAGGYDLSTYGYTREDDATASTGVTVTAGAGATASITNDYTGKTYTIIFDAGEYGKVNHKSGTWTYTWEELSADGVVLGYDWAGSQTAGTGSKVVFTFTQDQYLTYKDPGLTISSAYIPLTKVVEGATAKTGTTTVENPVENGKYYFNNGGIFTSIADAYAAMNDPEAYGAVVETDENGNLSITYTADYTFTYTFNDYGSTQVDMAYWVEDQEGEALTAATANTKVTEQANLESIDLYKDTIFFVKAKSGYQINDSSSLKVFEGTKGSGTGENRTLIELTESTAAPAGVDSDTWAAAKTAALKAGYTHFFSYTDNTVFNHWFKVTATKDPVVALGGTKIVALGGNTAPGQQSFTFKLETFVEDEEENIPVAKAVNRMADVPGFTMNASETKTVTTNGAGEYPYAFDEITYTEEGTYYYRLYEVIPEVVPSNWTYDQSVYYITVEVTDNGYGQLTAEVTNVKLSAPDAEPVQTNVVDFTNTYTRNTSTGPIDPGPIDPGPIDPGTDIPDDNTPTTDLPEEETPTTELPEEETPTTELPEEEVPMAEVPATGDNAGLWALAAGVSGLALVWLALTGKKRREENA